MRSPAHRALLAARAAGHLTAAQADVLLAPRPAEELYYTPDDPEHLKNMAAAPAHAAVLAEMRSLLDAWTEATHDSVPANLSRDEHDRETGRGLQQGKDKRWFRGAPPGTSSPRAPAEPRRSQCVCRVCHGRRLPIHRASACCGLITNSVVQES